jgi:3-isopropylmalate/(R)-2-methylmalate dehydratase small subunit
MEPFGVLRSRVVLFPRNDIDTDQIIPAEYTLLPSKAEIAKGLFARLRAEEADFPLNDPRARHCRILLAGENFGCGSSREQAVWALVENGFRAVIGRSFGDIFRNNAVQNGLLLVELGQQEHQALVTLLSAQPDFEIIIDLPAKILRAGNLVTDFAVDDFSHELLTRGHDTLEYLLARKEEVERYEREQTHPTIRLRLTRKDLAPAH